jgi:tetratricopeptide (TPR) repeat protein
MRAITAALAAATLLTLSAPSFADDIADCNSDQPQLVISGCTALIDAGKANKQALAVAFFNRGNALDDAGDHEKAIADYDSAIKLKPDYADGYLNRGMAKESTKDYDGAIADYSEVVKLDPSYAKAFYARARAYEAKGDLQQALAGYQEAAKLVPDSAKLQQKIVEIQQKLGQ